MSSRLSSCTQPAHTLHPRRFKCVQQFFSLLHFKTIIGLQSSMPPGISKEKAELTCSLAWVQMQLPTAHLTTRDSSPVLNLHTHPINIDEFQRNSNHACWDCSQSGQSGICETNERPTWRYFRKLA